MSLEADRQQINWLMDQLDNADIEACRVQLIELVADRLQSGKLGSTLIGGYIDVYEGNSRPQSKREEFEAFATWIVDLVVESVKARQSI